MLYLWLARVAMVRYPLGNPVFDATFGLLRITKLGGPTHDGLERRARHNRLFEARVQKVAIGAIVNHQPVIGIIEHEALRDAFDCVGQAPPRLADLAQVGQQVGPYLEILRARLGVDEPVRRYMYAVRICPEPEHWGGLSGCSYSEGISWGKFVPESEGGRFAEVYADATIAWPLVVRSVIERIDSERDSDASGA